MALATHVPHSRSRIFGALSPFLPTRCAPRFTSQLTAIAHSAVRASLRAGGRLAPSDWTDHRTPGAKRDAVAMATTDELGRTMRQRRGRAEEADVVRMWANGRDDESTP